MRMNDHPTFYTGSERMATLGNRDLDESTAPVAGDLEFACEGVIAKTHSIAYVCPSAATITGSLINANVIGHISCVGGSAGPSLPSLFLGAPLPLSRNLPSKQSICSSAI